MPLTEAQAALISGILATGASAAQSVSASKANRRGARLARELNDKNIQYQKDANDLAYSRALNMWNMENDYNTPTAQMQRYADAGLNPNLIYQQENTASDIGAEAPVAPSNDLAAAELTANSGVTGLVDIVRNANEAYSRYHQEKMDTQRLRLAEAEYALKTSQFAHQKDMSEYQKRSALANARNAEANADFKEWQNTEEYRKLNLINLQNQAEQARQNILSSDLSNKEKSTRLKYLDRQLRNQQEIELRGIANAILDHEIKKLDVEKRNYALESDRLQNLINRAVSKALEYSGATDFIAETAKDLVKTIKSFIDNLKK